MRIALYIIILLYSPMALCQSEGFDLPTLQWGKKLGLQQNSVNAVTMDRDNILWIGTPNGVYRHEGHEFINLNTILSQRILDNPINVQDIIVDNENMLWIATKFTGVFKYDIAKNHLHSIFTKEDPNADQSALRTYGLHQYDDQNIRFSSHKRGLINYNIPRDSLKILSVFSDKKELARLDGFQLMLRPIKNQKSDLVKHWYSSLAGLVFEDIKNDTFLYFNPPWDDALGVRDAYQDTKGDIWCATYSEGIHKYDPIEKDWEVYRCADVITSFENCMNAAAITEYNDTTVIFAGFKGPILLDKQTGVFTHISDLIPQGSWSGNTSQFRWLDGALWSSSYSSTLYKFMDSDLGFHCTYSMGQLDEALYDHNQGCYYSIANGVYLNINCGKLLEQVRAPKEITENAQLESIVLDPNGTLWLINENALFSYQRNNQTPFKRWFPDVKIHEDVHFRRIGLDRENRLWISSHDGRLFRVNAERNRLDIMNKEYGGPYKLKDSYRLWYEESYASGDLLFSAQDGFFLYNYSADKFLSANLKTDQDSIFSMPVSPCVTFGQTYIYFGSKTKDIYRIHRDSLQAGTVQTLNLKTDIVDMRIRDLIYHHGYLWVTGEVGLVRIDINKLTSTFYGDEYRIESGNLLRKTQSDELLFTDENRIFLFDTDRITRPYYKPNIHIKSVLINGVSKGHYTTGALIRLGPKDSYIQVAFNDYNYQSRRNKEYALKVEGFHDDWVELGNNQVFTLAGISGGAKTIMVKSRLAFHEEYSEPITLLELQVTPPLLRRWWFWVLIVLGFGAIGLLFYKLRIRQFKNRQKLIIEFNKQIAETEMKALRAQMNPHFLFNVLNAIKLNVQKNEQESAISFITDFSKLIRSVLQNSSRSKISLSEELEALVLYCKIEGKRFTSSFDFKVNVEEDLNLDKITIPPMLLQPYVENAIWHGILHKSDGQGLISIDVKKQDNAVVISIQDNGIGRTKASQLKLKSANRRKSMGMQITKDRMSYSNLVSDDKISVTIDDLYNASGISEGTKVILRIAKA